MFKFKKIVSLFLALVLTIGLIPSNAVAAGADSSENKACYMDSATGDNMTIEVVTPKARSLSAKGLSPDVTVTRIERNGEFEELIYVDFSNNILAHEYADGRIETAALSDVVTITDSTVEEAIPTLDDAIMPFANYAPASTYATDYVWDEPLGLDSNGNQLPLTGAATYSGYRAMGSRSGDMSSSTVGYLQRKDSGLYSTTYAHNFEFAVKTTVEEAISIIYSFLTGEGLFLAIDVVTSLMKVVRAWELAVSVDFKLLRYRWNYRVRLGSNSGQIIGTYYRDISYWKSIDSDTGDALYERADSSYMYGYMQDNVSMINAAINSYLGL